uniref:Fibrinogen C-terminal domain-containing protein n=1 Tax=Amphimedon queenslandica TaxID=400682 RepID=A0A1X7USA6_AMPQE
MTQRLLALHNFSVALPTSCKEIEQEQPSGMYELASFNETYEAYCHMEELCGSKGGWTRLAYLNMSDFSETCPSGLRLYQSEDVSACGRPLTSSAGCVSVQFPSNGISYSQICGRVTGYQYGTPDAVHSGFTPNHNNLNGDYVDGVSITQGSPRKHVWTLIVGFTDQTNSDNIYYNCPCSTGSTQHIQSFVGNHYTCESGNPTTSISAHLYTSDPLWDGQGCSSHEAACCDIPGIPWFHRDYGNATTTDYIELRVCGDEGTDNEDTPVSYYEIYVK